MAGGGAGQGPQGEAERGRVRRGGRYAPLKVVLAAVAEAAADSEAAAAEEAAAEEEAAAAAATQQ